MASNITQISEAVENLNTTFTEVNTTDFLTQAIASSNESTNGWMGIIIFIILGGTIIIHFLKNKQSYALFDDFSISIAVLSVILDVALILLMFGILESYVIFGFLFTIFFILSYISLLRKDLLSPEQ